MSLLIAPGFVNVRSCTQKRLTPSVPSLDILAPSGACLSTLNGLTPVTCGI